MNRGIRRVGVAVTVLVLLLVGQLTYLQVIEADDLANDPRNVRVQLRDVNRTRGEIITSDGEVVARSVRSNDGTEFEYQREYPLGPLFAQVAGYQSFVFGNTGVERVYNDVLVGRDIELQLRGFQDIFSGRESVGSVVLSLSAEAQRRAADALGNQRGSVVVVDVRTGEIVTLYSNPTFDPQPLAGHDTKAVQQYFQQLSKDPAKPDLARAYRERYAPGSTFKVVTAATALDDGVASPETTFPVLPALDLPLTDNVLENFGGRSCGGTLVDGLVGSCNTTFGQLGLDLGERLVDGMNRFGLFDRAPIDLVPDAVAGLGPLPGTFQDSQPLFAFAGIGQGDVAVTPLQMALVAAAVANGGVVMRPHVVAEIRDADGQVVRVAEPREWRRAMTPATASALAAMMRQVVERGTGTAARIPGIAVAGKTGTAQAEGGPPHAWFIGFAPAEAPRYAVAVLIERGGSLGDEATGGRVAAPIAATMLRTVLGI